MKKKCQVFKVQLDSISMGEAVADLMDLSKSDQRGYVCFVNAHSLVTSQKQKTFEDVLNGALFALPDGTPVAWLMNLLSCRGQKRVCGPDLMLNLCRASEEQGKKVFLYGSTKITLRKLEDNLKAIYPSLQIVGAISPPFRELSEQETKEHIKNINDSGSDFVFVSLGCPKQETWMACHQHEVEGVMLGLGAAFDFYAGNISRAPAWMGNIGLEWFYRFLSEPKRLWRRYLVTNSLFIYFAFKQLFFKK